MKRIFKIVLLAIGVFWGTVVILEAKNSVEKYVAKHKEEQEVVETTNFISKKGSGFVDYVQTEMDLICEQIEEVILILRQTPESDQMKFEIEKLEKINNGLVEIVEKKAFVGLDSFIIKVKDFSTLVTEYIQTVNMEFKEKNDGKEVDVKILEKKQESIINIKNSIEDLVKTLEVN